MIRINSGGRIGSGSFILPFSTNLKPSTQLRDSGVDIDNDSLRLLFNPGWIERSFNPHWIRNMFL